jgi:hypothetical protein
MTLAPLQMNSKPSWSKSYEVKKTHQKGRWCIHGSDGEILDSFDAGGAFGEPSPGSPLSTIIG